MINSKIRNNIYALISLTMIIITIASFAFIVNFLVRMNGKVFNLNNSNQTDSPDLNIEGYNAIKDKLETR